MSLQEFSSQAALSNLKSRSAIWPQRGLKNRKGLLPLAEVKPRFRFQKDDSFFCMGSCFAQHVGAVIANRGYSVLTHRLNPYAEGDWGGSNHLIRYNILALRNEFKWALDPGAAYSEAVWVEEGSGVWMDPTGHYHHSGFARDRLAQMRQFTLAVTRTLQQAKVVVVTLGLVEVWYDKKLSLDLNLQPSRAAMRAEPDRFVLRVLSYEEILAALEDIHGLLSRFGQPGVRMLLTTSPVPLQSTYRGQDVLVANMYSKSVQRAAAEAFVLRHGDVDYFPSYEAITMGMGDFVWKDDQRHVTEMAVDGIMTHVLRNYGDELIQETPGGVSLRNMEAEFNALHAQGVNLAGMIALLKKQQAEIAVLKGQLASLNAA